jgi:type II secretory pathway pseudopilin PulG
VKPRAFTFIELLVVIATIAVLVGIVVPALAGTRQWARVAQCGSNARQIAMATQLYADDWKNGLPQTRVELPWGGSRIGTSAFGGRRGSLAVMGAATLGPADRPLNAYVDARTFATSDDASDLAVFRSPLDRGAAWIEGDQQQRPVESVYHAVGTSYVLNDHGLEGLAQRTLVPKAGGPMPRVEDTSFTWLAASAPIYAFELDNDHGMQWTPSSGPVEATIAFVDLHVALRVPVPNRLCEYENTTDRYTFFPGRTMLGELAADPFH